MGFTSEQKLLFRYIVDGDRERTVAMLKRVLENASNTKADGNFAKAMLEKITRKAERGIDIPPNLTGILSVKYPDDKDFPFIPDRYYLSSREEPVVERIVRMYAAAQELKEHRIKYFNATLLHGDTGVGKTELGKYIAYRMNLPFVYLNFTNVLDSYLGKTGQNIERAFNLIKAHPCVFMIDEIDAIGEMRHDVSSSTGQENGRIVTSLFLCLDKLTNDNIVIAATNRPDILDKALISRFRLQHKVELLNRDERKQMARKYLKATGFLTDENEERLERELEAFSQERRTPRELEADLIHRIADSVVENLPLSLAVSERWRAE